MVFWKFHGLKRFLNAWNLFPLYTGTNENDMTSEYCEKGEIFEMLISEFCVKW